MNMFTHTKATATIALASSLGVFFSGSAWANTTPLNSFEKAQIQISSKEVAHSTVLQQPTFTPQPTSTAFNPAWPSNIQYAQNKIEFANAKTLGRLYQKWKSNSQQPIVVAHFGDSHIQTGWQIAPLRQAFQNAKGNAGRGMIFPYAIAKTYSQEDYTSSFTGTWKTANSIHQPPKIGVGVSGFVGVTKDHFAQVKFNFTKAALGNIQATVLFRALDGDYQLTMSNGSQSQTINVSSQAGQPTQTATFDLGMSDKSLSLSIQKQGGDAQAAFELHGINLTHPNQSGVIYHNLGVGGAAFNAIVQQKHFAQQFPMLNADLVVLDWGTNNILYTNKIDANFESTVRRTIQQVRAANPDAAILLTSAQEARYKGQPVTISAELSALMRRIAIEENCLFYDWYTIAGASDSVFVWKNAGFASKDNIHLNGKGYRIRGELLSHALFDVLNK